MSISDKLSLLINSNRCLFEEALMVGEVDLAIRANGNWLNKSLSTTVGLAFRSLHTGKNERSLTIRPQQ